MHECLRSGQEIRELLLLAELERLPSGSAMSIGQRIWPATRINHSGRDLNRLDRVTFAPGIETADEGGGIEPFFAEVERRPGARRFVWSGAVSDHRAVMVGLALCPVRHLTGWHT